MKGSPVGHWQTMEQ